MKISSKIYLIFGAIYLLTIFSVTGTAYYSTKSTLVEVQYSAATRLVEFSAKRIDTMLQQRLTSARIMAERPLIFEALTGASADKRAQLKESLRLNLGTDQEISAIYILDRNKNAVVSANGDPQALMASEPAERKITLDKVFNGEAAYSDAFASAATGEPTMIFAAPIFDKNKNIIGAVEVYLNWSTILSILKEIDVEFVHLLNRDGLEIGSNDPENYEDFLKEDYGQRSAYKNFLSLTRQGGGETRIETDLHQDVEVIMSHAHLPGYADYKGNDWILVLEEATDPIMGAINLSSIYIAVITSALLMLTTAVLLIFLKKYLLSPISTFSEISERITAGDLAVRIPVSGKDEIGTLAMTFNKMLDNLQKINLDLEARVKSATAKLEAELNRVKSQELYLEKNKNATLNLLEDISKEKKRVENLALELSKFELAVENAHEHMIITDPDGVVLYANAAAERITGYSRDEIIGNKPSLWGRQMPREFYAQMWKTIKADRNTFIGQFKNKRKNGYVYEVDAQISPIFDASGALKFFIAIERDITEQKKLDEARNNFISVASHQLRTPLTAIKWTAEILLGGDIGAVTPEQKEFVEDLRTSVGRMIDLVNSLLNIARIESNELAVKNELVDFKKIISDLIKEIEPLMEIGQKSVSLDMQAGIPDMYADSRLLYEILKNLLTNAVKYSKEKGAVKISVEKINEEIVISVRDNGIGIPKEDHEKIFNKFFRAANALRIRSEGTGLGMYIAKSLANLMGSRIWFESEENVGSTFYLALPAGGVKERAGSKDLASVKTI